MADRQLPHLHFLATRMLPCGRVDQPIRKFTGNHDCGEAPNDALTTALHSFSHFVGVYSNKDAVLCDLQGELFSMFLPPSPNILSRHV